MDQGFTFQFSLSLQVLYNPSIDREHDLAHIPVLLENTVCFLDILDRKNIVDHRFQQLFFEKRQ